jgi:hypothetical protein
MYPLSYLGSSNVVSAADFNGDGRPDIAVADDSVEVYLSDGVGGLRSPLRHPIMTFEPSPLLAQGPAASLFAADFDADGKADVGVASTWGLQIKRGDGTGKLLGPKTLPAPGRGAATASADFNGDLLDDVVAVVNGAMSASVVLWLSDGMGSLSGPAVYPLTSSPQQLVVGDVTNDGAPDVVVPTLMVGRIDTLVNARDGGLPGCWWAASTPTTTSTSSWETSRTWRRARASTERACRSVLSPTRRRSPTSTVTASSTSWVARPGSARRARCG